MATDVNHTHTPWKITGPSSGKGTHDDGGDYAIVEAETGNNYIVAEAFSKVDHGIRYPAEANAKFIVRACNCHDALVKACQRLMENMEEIYRDENGDMEWDGINLAREALIKAEAITELKC